MESKNLNDIVIEDNDSSKKAQLKNILTLLALLFIILVISIVITKLILGNDSQSSEANLSTGTGSSITESTTGGSDSSTAATVIGTTAALGTAAVIANSNSDTTKNSSTKAEDVIKPILTERNNSTSKKIPLRDHRPKESTKRVREHKPTPRRVREHRPTPKKVREHKPTPKKVIHKDTYVKKRHIAKPTEKPSTVATKGYYIQIGVFKEPKNAIRKVNANHLTYKTLETSGGLTKVLVGPYFSQKEAQNDLSKVKANVSSGAYIKKIR
jgi:cell division septation protein DedD